MSNPAQGAVGAETMTVAERVCHEEQMTIWSSEMAERLAMGGWLREHLSYEDKLGFYTDLSEGIRDIVESALDLSTPGPRTDGGMTAGEEHAWTFERTRTYLLAELERLRADLHTIGEDLTGEQGKAASWLDVATGRVANVSSVLASVTPAQPAGAVPDSLREAFEAAELHECWVNGDTADVMTNPYGHCDNFDQIVARCATGDLWRKRAVAIAMSLNFVREQIASHPAGQSAGSGETIAVQKRDLVKMVDAAFAVDPSVPTEAQGDNLFAAATKLASYLPLGLECTGCGSRESIEAIQARGFSSCCPERKMQPAPDSTRTGQGEAEETRRKEVDRIVSALRRLAGSKVIVRAEDQDAILGAADVLDEYQSEAAAIVECRGLRWSAWSEDDADSIATDPLVGYSTDWYVGVYADEDPDPIFRIMVGGDKRAELLARKVAAALNDGAPCPALARAPAVEGSGSPMANLKREVVALRAQARSNLAFYEEHGSDIALLESQRVAAFEEVLALLAARPAAPEAQGAWSFDMEAAPRDGTRILVTRESETCNRFVEIAAWRKDTYGKGHWALDGGFQHSWHRAVAWQHLNDPAPPASSGQEG